MRMNDIKAKFNGVVKLVESLGDNGYTDVEWCGKEFTVGINGSGRYTLLVRRCGQLYFDTEEEAMVYADNHIRENDINLIRFDVSVCKEPAVEE